jgi:hypothetical protein
VRKLNLHSVKLLNSRYLIMLVHDSGCLALCASENNVHQFLSIGNRWNALEVIVNHRSMIHNVSTNKTSMQ